MNDELVQVRRKSRYIVELRWVGDPRIIDQRGRLTSVIGEQLKDLFPASQVDAADILFGDRLPNPVNQLQLGSALLAIRIEDAESFASWTETAKRCITAVYNAYAKEKRQFVRLGVRHLSIFSGTGLTDFSSYNSRFASRFLKLPEKLPLQPSDTVVRVVHEAGSYQIGPVRPTDEWVTRLFLAPNKNVPEAGLGLDVDSFVSNVEVVSLKDLLNAVEDVRGITQSTEMALARHAGLLDG